MTPLPDATLVAVGADCATAPGDTVYDPGGHPVLVAGLAQFYQRIGRLLAAEQVLGSPGAGAGFAALMGQPLTPPVQQQALANAQTVILADPLTASIAALALDRPAQDQVRLSAQIVLVGQPAPVSPISLIWVITP